MVNNRLGGGPFGDLRIAELGTAALRGARDARRRAAPAAQPSATFRPGRARARPAGTRLPELPLQPVDEDAVQLRGLLLLGPVAAASRSCASRDRGSARPCRPPSRGAAPGPTRRSPSGRARRSCVAPTPGRGLPVAVHVAVPVDAAGEARALEGARRRASSSSGADDRLAEARAARRGAGTGSCRPARSPSTPRARSPPPGETPPRSSFSKTSARVRVRAPRRRRPAAGTRGCTSSRPGRSTSMRISCGRLHRRARQVRRVHADHARDPLRMEHGHRPHHEPAPVVPDEHRALDAEGVEQADEVAGQVVDVVGLRSPRAGRSRRSRAGRARWRGSPRRRAAGSWWRQE